MVMMDEVTKIESVLRGKQLRIWKQKQIKVKRKVRKALKMPFVGKTVEQKAILSDVLVMYEDILDFLLYAEFKCTAGYMQKVNAFLELERTAFDYPIKLEYKPGNMLELMQLILLHHNRIDDDL